MEQTIRYKKFRDNHYKALCPFCGFVNISTSCGGSFGKAPRSWCRHFLKGTQGGIIFDSTKQGEDRISKSLKLGGIQ